MSRLPRTMAGALAVVLGTGLTQAQAAPCSTSDVTITSIAVNGTSTNLLGSPLLSRACVGAYAGNDKFDPQTNLGYAGDGLFNGGKQNQSGLTLFPNGIFAGSYTETDLNGDGVLDPGWIRLGSWDNDTASFNPALVNGQAYAASNWFSVTETSAGKGTWKLDLPPNIIALAASIFGPNLFDHLVLSIKAGDNFAAYDFSSTQAGTPIDVAFDFEGSWDTRNTLRTGGQDGAKNPAGLSHMDLYIRDPIQPTATQLPEPSSLALVGLALAGLGLRRRQR